ncbi:MAG: PepSY-associated TM helix domain-containing protein [Pseudomonadota bacterium]
MNLERHRRLVDLHGVVGLFAGVLLYAVCLSGTAALFAPELSVWTTYRSASPTLGEAVSLDALGRDLLADAPEGGEVGYFSFGLPRRLSPYVEAYAIVTGADGAETPLSGRWDSASGAPIAVADAPAGAFLIDLHTHLLLPQPIGGYLVGFAGFLLLASVIGGYVVHRSLVRDAFVLRSGRALWPGWADVHKSFGLWAGGFFGIMAFSGVILTVMQPLTDAVNFVAYQGARANAYDTHGDAPPPRADAPATMLSLDDALTTFKRETGVTPIYINIANWGDENAQYTALHKPEGALTGLQRLAISGVDGAVAGLRTSEEPGPVGRLYAALSPLHYGDYGGLGVKALYGALGGALSLVIASGSLMWLAKRADALSPGVSGPAYVTVFSVGFGLLLGVQAIIASAPAAFAAGSSFSGAYPLFVVGAIAVCAVVAMRSASRTQASAVLWAASAALSAGACLGALATFRSLTGFDVGLAIYALLAGWGAARLAGGCRPATVASAAAE